MKNRYTRRYGCIIGATDAVAVTADAMAVASPETGVLAVIGWNNGQVLDATENDVPYFGLASADRVLVAAAPDRLDIFDPLELVTPILSIAIRCATRPVLFASSVAMVDRENRLRWFGLDGIETHRIDLPFKPVQVAAYNDRVILVDPDGVAYEATPGTLITSYRIPNLRGIRDLVIADDLLYGVGQEHVIVRDMLDSTQIMVDHDTWNLIRRVVEIGGWMQRTVDATIAPAFPFDTVVTPNTVLASPVGSTDSSRQDQLAQPMPADADLRARRLSEPFLRRFRLPNLPDAFDLIGAQYGRKNFPVGNLADQDRVGDLIRCMNGRWTAINSDTGELTWKGSELLRFSFGESDAAVQATDRHSGAQYAWTAPVEKITVVSFYANGPAVRLTGQSFTVPLVQQLVAGHEMLSLSFRLRVDPSVIEQTLIEFGDITLTVVPSSKIINIYLNGIYAHALFSNLIGTINWIVVGVTILRLRNGQVWLTARRGGANTNAGPLNAPYTPLALVESMTVGSELFNGDIADVRLYSTPQDTADFTALEASGILP